MVIVSTRDFRQNQTRYLGMANSGEDVILKSRSGNFKISPVTVEDAVVRKRDLAAELKEALAEVTEHMQGKHKLNSVEQLINGLRSADN